MLFASAVFEGVAVFVVVFFAAVVVLAAVVLGVVVFDAVRFIVVVFGVVVIGAISTSVDVVIVGMGVRFVSVASVIVEVVGSEGTTGTS